MAKKRSVLRMSAWLTLSAVLVSGIVIRSRYGASGFLENCASCSLYPILVAQQKVSALVRRNQAKLQAPDIISLQSDLEDVRAENARLRALIHYEQQTKELRAFDARYAYEDATLASVLSRHISDQAHHFFVAAGSRQGVERDMVAVYKNSLIGRVVQVYPWYSKVVLITDASCKIAAYCADTGATGIHHGANNLEQTTLNRVTHLDAVQEGDLVISSGQGLVFPQGFALGTIQSSTINGLFYDVHVAPLHDINMIAYCHILKKGEHATS